MRRERLKRRKRAPKSHVRLLSDGSWRLDLTSTDPDGARRRRRPRYGSESAALKAEAEALRRIENNLLPFPEEERPPATVRDLFNVYHVEAVPDAKPRAQDRLRDHRRELEAILGDLEVEKALTYGELLRYRRQRKEDYRRRTGRVLSDVTVAKELSHLRSALRYGKVNRRIRFHVFEELTDGMRRDLFPSEKDGKGQFIEAEVFEAIVSHLLPTYRPLVRFMRESGTRKGEATLLRWRSVKRDRIEIEDLPGNKTGARTVPLTPEMRALLPPRKLDPDALVFETPCGGSAYVGVGQAWDEARRKAGHPTVRLHDLRHSLAVELDELGDRTALEEALGMHGATVARYVGHRIFQRSTALFERRRENRHKLGTRDDANAASE